MRSILTSSPPKAAVSFFLPGEMCIRDRSEYNALKHCFKSRSLEFSDEIYNGYHNINKKLWKDFEKGKIEKPKLVTERFRILLSDLGYSIDPAEFNLSYGEAPVSYTHLISFFGKVNQTILFRFFFFEFHFMTVPYVDTQSFICLGAV